MLEILPHLKRPNDAKEKPVRKYDEEEEGWDGGDEEESPEKPPGKKVKISQDKKRRKKYIDLRTKKKKKATGQQSPQAFSTLDGCGRPAPEQVFFKLESSISFALN